LEFPTRPKKYRVENTELGIPVLVCDFQILSVEVIDITHFRHFIPKTPFIGAQLNSLPKD
jgi:hypothetical protein